MTVELVPVEPPSDFAAADTGAPLLLITGMPGSGKTNYMIETFAIGKRDVYQCNIPDCSLPSFDPEKWADLLPSIPVDSTLLFDEGREVFPPKSATVDPPLHYVLNRIRHTGRRVVVATQHPNDIDARVRRLASRHLHFKEAFGGGASEVFEWRGKIGDPDSTGDALRWKYGWSKRAFKLYKSTELHRGSAKKPWKVRMIPWLVIGAVVLLLAGGVGIYLSGKHVSAVATGGKPVPADGARAGAQGAKEKPPMTQAEYVQSFVPRIEGFPHTAIRYDELAKPVRAPFPAACVQSATRCSCFTQQATPLTVPDSLCRQMVAGGTFQDFNPDPDRPVQTPSAPVQVAAVVPVPPAGFGVTRAPEAPSASILDNDRTVPGGRGRALPKPN